MIEAHEMQKDDDMDDSKVNDRVEETHTDESKTANQEVETGIPSATWPPEIIPPPEGTHSGCSICGDNYYSVRVQEVAISLSNTDNQKIWPVYRNRWSDEAAQRAIYELNEVIVRNLSSIKKGLRHCGDLVLSRWTKKSKEKRGRLLHSAAGTCFGVWPPSGNSRSGWTEEEVAQWGPTNIDILLGSGGGGPSLNIEEFAEDRMKLFALLHVRSSHEPWEWAMFDSREMFQFFWTSSQPMTFNPKCVSMLPEDYGKLVNLDVKALHSGTALGFPRAWAMFNIQYHMAFGLCNILNMIVAEGSISGDLRWNKMVSDGLHSSAGEARWGIYENEAFAPPSKFDPEVLLEMVRDQLNHAADEVELLQGDPESLRSYALNMKANISWDAGVSPSMKWSYIASNIILLWTQKLSRWQAMFEKSQELVSVCRERGGAIQNCSELPESVKTTIVEYGAMIKDLTEMELPRLRFAAIDMHATKEVTVKHEMNGELYREYRYSGDFTKQGDRILHAIFAVFTRMPSHHMTRGTLRNLSAELAQAKFDKRVQDSVSTIGLLEAMRSIWLSAHVVSHEDLCNMNAGGEAAEKRVADLSEQQNHPFSQQSFGEKYPRLGSILRDFCECPWPKNRSSATWLDKMSEARRLQANFWRSAREHWQKDQHNLESHIVDTVVDYMSFDLSPRYHAEVEEERTSFETESQQRLQAAKPLRHPSTHVLQSVWGEGPETSEPMRFRNTSARHNKTKERDIVALNPTQKAGAVAVEPTVRPTIAVKQSSKKVFDKIFSRTATASKFRWTHLVSALTDAGMVATQSAGSAVKFNNHQGSIVFHCPHGDAHDSALSAEFLRNEIGKRLTKWFSWDRETFVERTKTE